MLKRLLKALSQSFFLLGPRGTGKSTWLQTHFPDAYMIDLLSEATFQSLLANPGLILVSLPSAPVLYWGTHNDCLIIDHFHCCLVLPITYRIPYTYLPTVRGHDI
jgi:hypothetical protein